MTAVSEWPQKRFVDLAKIGSGGTPPSNIARYYGGGIPWVSIADMTENGKYIERTKRTLTDEGLAIGAAKLYPAGSVLYAIYASLGECSIAKGCVSSSQAILGIVPGSGLDGEFLYYHLESIKPRVKMIGQQGTQSNLNAGMVRDFQIQLPELAEQRSIAEALSVADRLIASLERLIAKKRAIKHGMMQQLLTGNTRLPGFTREWEEVRLGEVLRFQVGFPFGSFAFSDQPHGPRLVRNRDLRTDDTIVYFTGAYSTDFVINNGDVLVGMDGDFALCLWDRGIAGSSELSVGS